MATTRADTLTGTLKTQDFYSDFLDSFATTLFGGDLGRVMNENSVTQSIKNLIYTNLGERLFQPKVGSNVLGSLFEMNDTITQTNLAFNISNTIKYNEPRCNLKAVTVDILDDHSIQVTIVYSLINNPTPVTINMLLKRVR